MKHNAYIYTYEKRGTGFRKIIEFVTTEDMAEDEREDEHHDLEKDAHSCRLLLLSGTTAPRIRRRYFIIYAHSRFDFNFLNFVNQSLLS